MHLIRPITVTDAKVTANNIAETDESEWDDGTAYTVGNRVMVTGTAGGAATATHGIYVAQGSTTGDDPTTDDGTNWVQDGYTNAWSMFDVVVQNQSTKAGGFEVEITPGEVTSSLALINVDAQSVDIEINDPGGDGIVYSENHLLISNSGIQDWYQYFFEPISRLGEFAITGLPAYEGAVITVTLNDTTTAKLGGLVVGQFAKLGDSQYGANFSIRDYSTKTTDADGRMTVTQSTFTKYAEIEVVVDIGSEGAVQRTLTSLLNQPIVWVAGADIDGTIIYGYYKEWNIIYSNPALSVALLEIEGLT